MLNKDIAKTASAHRTSSKQKGPLVLIILSVLVIGLLGFGGYKIFKKVEYIGYKDVKIGSETFRLEIADTEAARTKGLSQRDSIGENEGMLFDFKSADDWRIWMIDMHFNLDIAWLNQSGKVIFIKENATPASYPEVYHASMPSWYVIELPAGSFGRINLSVGDTLDL